MKTTTKTLVLGFVTMLLFLTTQASIAQSKDVKKYLDLGEKLVLQEKFDEAIYYFNAAVSEMEDEGFPTLKIKERIESIHQIEKQNINSKKNQDIALGLYRRSLAYRNSNPTLSLNDAANAFQFSPDSEIFKENLNSARYNPRFVLNGTIYSGPFYKTLDSLGSPVKQFYLTGMGDSAFILTENHRMFLWQIKEQIIQSYNGMEFANIFPALNSKKLIITYVNGKTVLTDANLKRNIPLNFLNSPKDIVWSNDENFILTNEGSISHLFNAKGVLENTYKLSQPVSEMNISFNGSFIGYKTSQNEIQIFSKNKADKVFSLIQFNDEILNWQFLPSIDQIVVGTSKGIFHWNYKSNTLVDSMQFGTPSAKLKFDSNGNASAYLPLSKKIIVYDYNFHDRYVLSLSQPVVNWTNVESNSYWIVEEELQKEKLVDSMGNTICKLATEGGIVTRKITTPKGDILFCISNAGNLFYYELFKSNFKTPIRLKSIEKVLSFNHSDNLLFKVDSTRLVIYNTKSQVEGLVAFNSNIDSVLMPCGPGFAVVLQKKPTTDSLTFTYLTETGLRKKEFSLVNKYKSFKVSNDGDFILFEKEEDQIQVYDVKMNSSFSLPEKFYYSKTSISPNSRFLLCTDKDGYTQCYNLTGVGIYESTHDNNVTAASWSPDNYWFYTGKKDGSVTANHLIDSKKIEFNNLCPSPVVQISMTGDPNIILVVHEDANVSIVNLKNRQELRRSFEHPVEQIFCSSDSMRWAALLQNKELFVLRNDGTCLLRISDFDIKNQNQIFLYERKELFLLQNGIFGLLNLDLQFPDHMINRTRISERE